MFRKNNYIKLCTHRVYALSEFRLNWRGMCRKCSCGCFFVFFFSMFLQCLPFQQTQCFAAGKLTERLGITYLTDSISSVVSKKKKKKRRKRFLSIRGKTNAVWNQRSFGDKWDKLNTTLQKATMAFICFGRLFFRRQ